jgi:hypothetical protein
MAFWQAFEAPLGMDNPCLADALVPMPDGSALRLPLRDYGPIGVTGLVANQASRHRPLPGGPPRLPASLGAGEPCHGRPAAAGPRRHRPRPRGDVGPLPRLRERSGQAAGTLSGGEQQMLAIARALMSRPRLVMFDEPSLGLAPSLVEQVFAIVQDIRATGTTVLMVEQNAMAALQLCDRAYLLETGHVLRTGTGAELLASPDVRDAYLGGGI